MTVRGAHRLYSAIAQPDRQHMQVLSRDIRRFRLPGFAWVPLAVVLMFIFSQLGFWIFWDGALNLFKPVMVVLNVFHLGIALLVWSSAVWLHPFLARHYPHRLAPRMVFGLLAVFSGVVLVTIAAYGPLFEAMMGRPVYPGGVMHVGYRGMMIALFVSGWILMRDYAGGQAAEALRLQLETEALATDVDRSELAMLEAQIEPHFLFNTLAHIKRMYRVEAAAADHVLGTLIDYLERALPALRRSDWTIGDELGLVGLYLELIEQRFAGRLRFSIASIPEAAALQLPALTVATLVENAVRHGLGPKAGDGQIRVAVKLNEGVLRIDVADDGVGLRQSSGSGLGLATVRARLRGKFGARANVIVQPGRDGGVLASIVIGAAHG
jgi:hypothetical protein